MKWRTSMLGVLFLGTAACLSGCGPKTESRLVSAHLVDHFRKAGVQGRYQRLNATAIGAVEGGRLSPQRLQRSPGDAAQPRFLLEFAKFDDPRKAERMAQRGFRPQGSDRVYPCYANGVFVMIVRLKPENKDVVKIFQSF